MKLLTVLELYFETLTVRVYSIVENCGCNSAGVLCSEMPAY